jgi:hypothetical protein
MESPMVFDTSNNSITCSKDRIENHHVVDADESLSPFNVTNASTVDN